MSDHLLSIPEAAGRVFVIYNTSSTVTPAYAATLVLVFSLGWIALIALVYYYLISGAFSSKGYSSGSSHSHYNAQKRGWFIGNRERRDITLESEHNFARIVQWIQEKHGQLKD